MVPADAELLGRVLQLLRPQEGRIRRHGRRRARHTRRKQRGLTCLFAAASLILLLRLISCVCQLPVQDDARFERIPDDAHGRGNSQFTPNQWSRYPERCCCWLFVLAVGISIRNLRKEFAGQSHKIVAVESTSLVSHGIKSLTFPLLLPTSPESLC